MFCFCYFYLRITYVLHIMLIIFLRGAMLHSLFVIRGARLAFLTKKKTQSFNTNFKLVSLNVRGLRSSDKRKALLLWVTNQKS